MDKLSTEEGIDDAGEDGCVENIHPNKGQPRGVRPLPESEPALQRENWGGGGAEDTCDAGQMLSPFSGGPTQTD